MPLLLLLVFLLLVMSTLMKMMSRAVLVEMGRARFLDCGVVSCEWPLVLFIVVASTSVCFDGENRRLFVDKRRE